MIFLSLKYILYFGIIGTLQYFSRFFVIIEYDKNLEKKKFTLMLLQVGIQENNILFDYIFRFIHVPVKD